MPVLAELIPEELALLLGQDGVEEVMINPDGSVRLEIGGQIVPSKLFLDSRVRETLARRIAAEWHVDLSVIMGGSLGDIRIQAVMPPLVAGASFSFRLPGRRQFQLSDFTMSETHCREVMAAITENRSILVSGATSSGKTSFANALLALPEFSAARLVTIEDTPELQPQSFDVV